MMLSLIDVPKRCQKKGDIANGMSPLHTCTHDTWACAWFWEKAINMIKQLGCTFWKKVNWFRIKKSSAFSVSFSSEILNTRNFFPIYIPGQMDSVQSSNILLVEPFYCGSHRQLADLLAANLSRCDLHVLPGKKWHWKARTAALTLSQNIPYNHHYRSVYVRILLTELSWSW